MASFFSVEFGNPFVVAGSVWLPGVFLAVRLYIIGFLGY